MVAGDQHDCHEDERRHKFSYKGKENSVTSRKLHDISHREVRETLAEEQRSHIDPCDAANKLRKNVAYCVPMMNSSYGQDT